MGHGHHHGEGLTGRRLGLSILLTLTFVAGEATAGWLANSLALLSDAGHNLAAALTGSARADPVISLVIGGLILWSSGDGLLEAVNVLLEGVPRGLDMAALERASRAVPGVLGVHDLHVWTVASGLVACSCHILV